MTDRSKAIQEFAAKLAELTMEELNEVECCLLYLVKGDQSALQRIPEPKRSHVMEICRRKEGTA